MWYNTPTHVFTSSAQPSSILEEVGIHGVLAASQIRAQLGQKARQVLGYLNSIRSLERPVYTVPVGMPKLARQRMSTLITYDAMSYQSWLCLGS